MKRQTLKITSLALVVAILGIVLWVNAGDPVPEGPVEPTMLTLQEIGDKVDGVSQQIDNLQPSTCCEPEWAWAYSVVSSYTGVQLVSGSGILHGVWIGHAAALELWDGDPNEGGSQIARFRYDPVGTNYVVLSEFYQLDVRFSNGLYAKGEACVTSLYRPDAG